MRHEIIIILKERRSCLSSYIHSKRLGILDGFLLQATYFCARWLHNLSALHLHSMNGEKKGREMQTPLEAQSTEIIIHIISVHSPLANPNMKSHSEATDTGKCSWTAT